MKTFTLLSTALLLAGTSLAEGSVPKFDFLDSAGNKFDSVDIPYDRENADKQCISHEVVEGKPAKKMEWATEDDQVLEADSYCVYLFYTDRDCGGAVDDMFVVPAEGQSIGWDTITYDQDTAATVIRSGPCPPEKPRLVPAPSKKDLGEE